MKRNTISQPKRFYSQNFLKSDTIVQKIISFYTEKDSVIEIGPGMGEITILLAKKINKIYALERDIELVNKLKVTVDYLGITSGKLEIISGDYLDKSYLIKKNISKPFSIFGNIPYHITKKIINDILVAGYNKDLRPQTALLMLQKEVAERIIGFGRKRSFLEILCKFYSAPRIIEYVGKDKFYPKPKVDSALVLFDLLSPNRYIEYLAQNNVQESFFWKVVSTGFVSPRKKLINNLVAVFNLKSTIFDELLRKVALSSSVRAEELVINQWLQLVVVFFQHQHPKNVLASEDRQSLLV